MFVADHYCNSLLGELYDHILPFLAQEATSVAACACVEDIIMDMTLPEAYSPWVKPDAETRGTAAAVARVDHFIFANDTAD